MALLLAIMVAATAVATGPQEQEEAASARTGAWVDEVVFLQEQSAAAGVSRLQADEMQVYAFAIADSEIYRRVVDDENLDFATSYGSYNEITFNPVGPEFPESGKLNPFSVPQIREAMNWLIDRDHIVQEIMGGLGKPRYGAVTTSFPDYTRMIEVNRRIELLYSYDPERAEEVITEEMEKLGASKVDGVWNYDGEPVTLIALIRTEDERTEIGDYVSNQLESIGFQVQREYKSGAEASPIWISGDPAAGRFHFYTGGWVTTAISRDQSGNFDFFYTPRGLPFQLWQAYEPSEDFDEIAARLADSDFSNNEERTALFAEALELSLKDSVRIWLADATGIAPFRDNISVAADLAGSIYGADLWAFTLRYEDRVGGTVSIGMPSMLPEPWNPLGGTNWVYDRMIQRATADADTMPDPYTGLAWPQRIESAEVTIKEGLPVTVTHDWVTLEFEEEIQVPDDAWIDWNATDQTFVTAGEKHPDGLTANRKVVLTYEDEILERLWHDGSTFSVGDMVMSLILAFDRANSESTVFDEAAVAEYESFAATFRGTRIVSEDPLVVEWYSNAYAPDAENNISSMFPEYEYGIGAWHTLGVGLRAEANGDLAFTSTKADKLEVEWTNMIAGPALETLKANLDTARSEGFVPYEPTLGQYISASDASERWDNLAAWYEEKGHFWVGLGPLYLERAFPVEQSAQLRRFEGFADPPEKWARFESPRIAEVDISGPARVTKGQSAEFTISVSFGGRPYAVEDMESVTYLLFDARDELVTVGTAEPGDAGEWMVSLDAQTTRDLPAGSNRIEIAVAPSVVSIPTFDSVIFATVNQ